jgi:hypothetical protein
MPKKFAIIENDIVVNVAIGENPIAENWIHSENAKIGDKYENGVFVTPTQNEEFLAKSRRSWRDFLLAESDWRIIKDLEITGSINQEWARYRQALRDIPSQSGFPLNVIWPEKP